MQVLTSLLALPIQLNWVGSKLVPPCVPIKDANGAARLVVPNTVPSLGAALYSQLARRRLPAPSMFMTMAFGLPGI